MSQTITLVPTTSFDGDVTYPVASDKVKGSGYVGKTFPMHTAQYSLSTDFVGAIKMQGTLVHSPTESDWFDISNTHLTVSTGETAPESSIVKFNGLFVWVRASYTIVSGAITQIQYIYS